MRHNLCEFICILHMHILKFHCGVYFFLCFLQHLTPYLCHINILIILSSSVLAISNFICLLIALHFYLIWCNLYLLYDEETRALSYVLQVYNTMAEQILISFRHFCVRNNIYSHIVP